MLKKSRAQQNDNNQYPLYVFEQLLRSDLKRLLASQTIPPTTSVRHDQVCGRSAIPDPNISAIFGHYLSCRMSWYNY